MTEAWDALVKRAGHWQSTSMVVFRDAILQGQAEIERLQRAVHELEESTSDAEARANEMANSLHLARRDRDIARKSTEEALELQSMGLRNREILLDELEAVRRELAELKAAVPGESGEAADG